MSKQLKMQRRTDPTETDKALQPTPATKPMERMGASALARTLGVTTQTVAKWVKKGLPSIEGNRGKEFSLGELKQWLLNEAPKAAALEHPALRDIEASASTPVTEVPTGETRSDASLRLTKANADLKELKLKIESGEYQSVADMCAILDTFLHQLGQRLDQFPLAVSGRCVNKSENEITQILKAEIHKIRTDGAENPFGQAPGDQ